MTIWINEQIDPCGLIYACIASCDREQAEVCHQEFRAKLTDAQQLEGWTVRLREVESWDEVPVTALKLSY